MKRLIEKRDELALSWMSNHGTLPEHRWEENERQAFMAGFNSAVALLKPEIDALVGAIESDGHIATEEGHCLMCRVLARWREFEGGGE